MMRKSMRHNALIALALAMLTLAFIPLKAFAATGFSVHVLVEGKGSIRAYDNKGAYTIVTSDNLAEYGPYSLFEKVPLPPARLEINSVDEGYYFAGRSWLGSNGDYYLASNVIFSDVTEPGDLGKTGARIGVSPYVTYRFEERKSTVTFEDNAPAGVEVLDVPSAMTLHATDTTDLELPSTLTCDDGEYWFSGWNTAADGSGTTYNSLAQLYATLRSDGYRDIRAFKLANDYSLDLKLYAQWEQASYTIHYDGGAADVSSLPSESQIAWTGVPDSLAPEPQREGYRFGGWIAPNGQVVTSTADIDNLVSSSNPELTLTASWLKCYTVRLYSADNPSVPIASLAAVEGTAQTLPKPERIGYQFVGWTLRSHTDVCAVSTADLDAYAVAGHVIDVDSTWDGLSYTIAYVSVAGSGNVNPQEAKVGVAQKLDAGTSLSYDNHDFAGWLATIDGNEKLVASTADLDSLIESAGQRVELRASWLGVYTIQFTAAQGDEGVTDLPSDQRVAIGSDDVIAPEARPHREGYAFAGWTFNGKTVTTTSDISREMGEPSVGAKIKLVAAWTRHYDVSFSPGAGDVVPKGVQVPAKLTDISVGSALPLDEPSAIPNGWEFVGWYLEGYEDAIWSTTQLDTIAIAAGGSIELVAHWNKYYAIMYNHADGTKPTTDYVVSGTWELPTPERSGYRFDGWTCMMAGVEKSITDIDTLDALAPAGGSVMLTAHWTACYSIVYNANGGIVEGDAQVNVTFGSAPALAGASWTNHSFIGWFTTANGSSTRVSALTPELESTLKPGDVLTLTAQWRKQYKVDFDMGLAAQSVSKAREITITEGESIILANPDETSSWRFDGWYLGDMRITHTAQLDATEAGATVILTAHWTKRYTVVFDAQGGQTTGPASVVVTAGESASLPSATREEHRFEGWYLETGGARVTNLNASFDESAQAGSTIRLIARWAMHYTVILDNNEGSSTTKRYDIYSSETTLFPIANRPGYRFDGWRLTNGISDETYSRSTELNDLATPGCTLRLVATWTKGYTVYLDHADGTGTVTELSVIEGEVRNFEELKRDNYRFDGWYSPDGLRVTKSSDIDSLVSASSRITLTAHWTAHYNVVFDVAGIVATPSPLSVYCSEEQKIADLNNTNTWRFDGWYLNGVGERILSTAQLDGADAGSTVALHAHWTKRYKVVLTSTGGTIKNRVIDAYADAAVELPEPSWSGHRFDGWYRFDTLVTDTTLLAEDVSAGGSVVLEAHWSAVYTVILDAAGGDVSPRSLTVVAGEAQALPEPQRLGYRFSGWHVVNESAAATIVSTSELDSLCSPGDELRLEALWTKTYTVILDHADGHGTESRLDIVAGEAVTLPVIDRDGYHFDGWFEGQQASKAVASTSELDATAAAGETIRLSARWTKVYAVNLDALDGSAPTILTVLAGETQNFNSMSRSGYRFDGWMFNGITVTSTADLDEFAIAGEELSVTAAWSALYTISFDANGGVVTPTSIEAVVGDRSDNSLPQPSREHFRFDGWIAENGSVVSKRDELDALATPGGVVTIKAAWVAGYTIAFDTASDGEVAVDEMHVFVGDKAQLPVPARQGWHFGGWSFEGLLVVTSDDLDAQAFAGARLTLQALWTKTYTVSLNPLLGSVSPSVLEVSVDEDLVLPIAVREGYRFDGWVTAGGALVASTADLDLAAEAGSIVYLRATWTKLYSVRFDAAGGTVQPASIEVAAGAPQALPTPVREGWSFGGWETADNTPIDNTSLLDAVASAGSTILVHAQWNKNYQVKLDPTGGVVEKDSFELVDGVDSPIVFPTPIRYGYRFNAWLTDDGRMVSSTADVSDLADAGGIVKVHASWSKTYALELHSGDAGDGSAITLQVVAGEEQALTAPSRRGYTFEGWYSDADSALRAHSSKAFDELAAPGATVRAYPAWRGQTYYIDYDANGGKGDIVSQLARVGESATLATADGFTFAGYRFAAWLSDPSEEGVVVSNTHDLDALITEEGQHVTVYAGWVEHIVTYTLHYEANADGELVSQLPSDQTIAVGSAITLGDGVTPIRTGWAFDGWSFEHDGVSAVVVSTADIIARLGDVPEDAVLTVKALWHKSYEIHYTLGVEGASLPESPTQTDTRSWLADPSCVGRKFTGWVTNDGLLISSLAEADAIAEPGGILEVKATWLKLYTVVLESRMVGVSRKTLNVTESESISLGIPATREGYSFVGWNTALDGSGLSLTETSNLDAVADPGATITVYAQWKRQGQIVTPVQPSNPTPTDPNPTNPTPTDPTPTDPAQPSEPPAQSYDEEQLGGSDLVDDYLSDIYEETSYQLQPAVMSQITSSTFTSDTGRLTIDESIQRREIPAEIAEMTLPSATNSTHNADRSLPSSSGKAARIEELVEVAEADAADGDAIRTASEVTPLDEAIATVANKNTWAGAGAMAVAGSAAVIAVSMFGAIMNGTAGAQAAQVAAALSGKAAAAGKDLVHLLKELLARLFSW